MYKKLDIEMMLCSLKIDEKLLIGSQNKLLLLDDEFNILS